ncbi:MAG: hypothetical protein KKD18_05775 [Nanoarchaeota archaeon]|nr:hypothetical protein [Nanoarchaeota archaeon]
MAVQPQPRQLTREEIYGLTVRLLRKEFNDPQIGLDSRLHQDIGADSLYILDLTLMLEDELGIPLEHSKAFGEKVENLFEPGYHSTVRDLADYAFSESGEQNA